MSDHHRILGTNPASTEAEIKAAYRRLAKEHHPDRNPDDPNAVARFHEISAAYEALMKPQEPTGFAGFDFFGDADQHRQMFEQMMRRMHEQEQRAQNSDVQTVIVISLLQAQTGCIAAVNLNLPTGDVNHEVNVPAGIENGQRIRITGAGLLRNTAYPPGDLYVVVRIAPEPAWARMGADRLTQVSVDALAAIMGTEVSFTSLSGETIRCDIPAGTQFGARISMQGLGMPQLNSDRRGNLIVEVMISIPQLSEIDRKLVDQLTNMLPNQNPSL